MIQKVDSYVTYRLLSGTIGVEILHYHLTWRGAAVVHTVCGLCQEICCGLTS